MQKPGKHIIKLRTPSFFFFFFDSMKKDKAFSVVQPRLLSAGTAESFRFILCYKDSYRHSRKQKSA